MGWCKYIFGVDSKYKGKFMSFKFFFLAVAKDSLVRLNQGGQLWEKAVDYDSINITLFLGKLKFIVTVD